jgi:hypothetical protein
LEIREPAHADNVMITLYLFRVGGPSTSDITKVFMTPPIDRDDDSHYFYGALPPPSGPK